MRGPQQKNRASRMCECFVLRSPEPHSNIITPGQREAKCELSHTARIFSILVLQFNASRALPILGEYRAHKIAFSNRCRARASFDRLLTSTWGIRAVPVSISTFGRAAVYRVYLRFSGTALTHRGWDTRVGTSGCCLTVTRVACTRSRAVVSSPSAVALVRSRNPRKFRPASQRECPLNLRSSKVASLQL